MEIKLKAASFEKIKTAGTLREMYIGAQPYMMLRAYKEAYPDMVMDVNNPRDHTEGMQPVRDEAQARWRALYGELFEEYSDNHPDYFVDIKKPAILDGLFKDFTEKYHINYRPLTVPATAEERLSELDKKHSI